MAREIILISIVMTFLAGCTTTPPAKDRGALPSVVQSSHIDPKTGKLVALWVPRGNSRSVFLDPVLVNGRYATYICWPSTLTGVAEGEQVFIFYDNVRKTCWQTRDYAAYLELLSRQPRDIEVLHIDTCTVSRSQLPDKEQEQLAAVMKARRMRWAINPANEAPFELFCYCESVGRFVYPGDGQ